MKNRRWSKAAAVILAIVLALASTGSQSVVFAAGTDDAQADQVTADDASGDAVEIQADAVLETESDADAAEAGSEGVREAEETDDAVDAASEDEAAVSEEEAADDDAVGGAGTDTVTDEASASYTVTAAMSLDTEYTVTISTEGEYVYFSFTPTEDGCYQFYSTGSYDTYSYLYDADWYYLTSNDDGGSGTNTKISWEMTAGVTYYIGFGMLDSDETGSFSVYAEKYNAPVSASISVSSGYELYQGIDSYTDYDKDDAAYDYYNPYCIEFSSGTVITITFADDTTETYTYNSDYGWFYNEDNEYLDFYYNTDQYEEHWSTGNTYTVELVLYDFDYLTIELSVSILENPWTAVYTIADGSDTLTAIEGIDSYTEYDDDDETYEYYSFWSLVQDGDAITITSTDESAGTVTITYSSDEGDFLDESGNYVSVYTTNNTQYAEHWTDYDTTYYFTLVISDYGVTVQVPVTISKLDLTSEDITDLSSSDEGEAQIEEAGGRVYFSYTAQTSDTYAFYSTGSYDTYAYLYDTDMNLLASDDDSGVGTNAMIKYDLEEGQTCYIVFRFYDSSATGSFSVYAEKYNAPVSASISVSSGYELYQGIDSYTDYDEDDEAYDYFSPYGIEFTSGTVIIITFEDETTETFTYSSGTGMFYNEDGNYLSYYYSTDQYEEHWSTGSSYTVEMVLYDFDYLTIELSVSILENPWADAAVTYTTTDGTDTLTAVEGIDSYTYYDNDNEAYEYYSFWNLVQDGDTITITPTDESTETVTITYCSYEGCFLDASGRYVDIWTTNNTQYEEHWTDYNTTYYFTLYIDDYDLTVQVPVKIVSADSSSSGSGTSAVSISGASVSIANQTYTGSALTPTPVVTLNGTTLTKGTDYTVSYSNNVNAGTATVTITGTGSYTGTVTKTFTISAQTLSASNVSLAYSSRTYTGSALTPAVTVKNAAGAALTSGYSVSYSGNKDVGTATVTITGTGNYTGTITKSFKITKATQSLTIKKTTKTVKYSSVKKKKQTVKAITKVSGAKGKVTYKKTSGKSYFTVNKSTGKITVKKGTKKGTYKIKIKVSAAATSNYKAASKTVTVTIKVK